MKTYNFLKVFKEFLRFFEKFLKFYRKFREKFRKFWKYGFLGCSPKQAKIVKDLQKNQWKPAKL